MSTEKKTVIYIAAFIVAFGLGLFLSWVVSYDIAIAVVVAAAPTARLAIYWAERPRRQGPPQCPKCHYPLEPFMRLCPECGHGEKPVVVVVRDPKKS